MSTASAIYIELVVLSIMLGVSLEFHLNCSTSDTGNLQIQCDTNKTDLTLTSKSRISDKSVRIAECIFAASSCFLMDHSFQGLYSISLTSTGGQLTIVNLTEEMYGTYTCFDTYYPDSQDTVDIPDACLQPRTQDSSDAKSTIVVTLAVVSGTAVVIVPIAVYVHKKHACVTTTEDVTSGIKDHEKMSNIKSDTECGHSSNSYKGQDKDQGDADIGLIPSEGTDSGLQTHGEAQILAIKFKPKSNLESKVTSNHSSNSNTLFLETTTLDFQPF